ncbi:MAG: SAM-dependent methyltransferase, partial [Verrucomicrobiaceae bacterium]
LGALQAHSPEFYEAVSYRIVEPSSGLRERQAATLGKFSGKASWATDLQELPDWTGVHFSNELIDAFPVLRIRWNGTEWQELYVGLEGGTFTWHEMPLSKSPALQTRIAQIPMPLPAGYEIEINLAVENWLHEVAVRLKRGWLLAIDYGLPRAEFFRPDRRGGTLAAYRAHKRVENPLSSPGDVDLTAHVEFTSIAEHANKYGLQLAGFTDQHHFMVGLSRLHFSDVSGPMSSEHERDLRGFKTLMHPGLLGMSFKALALSNGVESTAPLAGFAFARDPAQELALR